MSEYFFRILNEHWGKVLGGVLGLIIAILIVAFGFWRGLFIIICVLAGIFIGSRYEQSEEVRNFFRRLWERKERF